MKNRSQELSKVLIAFFCLLLLGMALSDDSYAVNPIPSNLRQFGRELTTQELNNFSQNNILFYDPTVCEDGSGSLVGTGEYGVIMKAKNAEEYFFNGSGTVPSFQWSATSTEDMKRILETYGDLAYQLGRAAGVPWIAVLAQAHHEDPQSVCGHNNFWGNGCNASHAYVGGADEVIGKAENLGEGFIKYAETVHNGYYEEALTKSDPLEYIRALEGTWIGTGSSYGIEGHINAMTAYVESPEGQAIVEKFYDYRGVNYERSSSSSSTSSASSSSSSSEESVTWEDGWITGGLGGYIKEPAEGSSYKLPEEAVSGGHTQEYSTNGKPNKILLHSTEGGPGDGTSGLALYGSLTKGGVTGITPAHFTIDLQNKKTFQHFSINKPSDAIIEDLDAGIQIEIIGFMNEGNSPSLQSFSDEDWEYLAKLLLAISKETGIELESSADWTHTNRYSEDDFRNYTGVLGHMHAPSDQNHDDPGDIWASIKDAISRVRGNCASGDSDVLSSVSEIIELANQNGSEYTWGGGHTSDASVFDAMLNGSPINVDCTGFASLVMYKTYGEMTSFTSESIFSDPLYKEVSRSEVQPGDIFAYNSPSGHGGIVIEVSDGVVTKIAETGGSGERSGSNSNIGYAGSESFSIQNMNGPNGSFFRWNGPNNGSVSTSASCPAICESNDNTSHSGGFTSAEEADSEIMQPYRDLARAGRSEDWSQYNITGGSWYNCFSFSNYFISRYTSIDFHGVGGSGGGGYAKNFYNAYSGSYPELKMSNKPTPYSVAGCGDEEYIDGVTIYSHTFIVLGVNEANDTMIYGEAALYGGEGGIVANEISLSDPAYGSRNGSTGICTYTDFSKYLTGL